VAGETCVKLKCLLQSPGQNGKPTPRSNALLWLAVNRHYLPLKSEIYAGSSTTNLLVREEVKELREIEPGIFVPWQAVKTNYWKRGTKIEPSQETTVSVRRASIRPDYPDQFFKDIPIPAGIPVYVQRGERIVESFTSSEHGEPLRPRHVVVATGDDKVPMTAVPSPVGGKLAIEFLGALCLAAAAVVLYRAYRRKLASRRVG
jgi:hypothetical protein